MKSPSPPKLRKQTPPKLTSGGECLKPKPSQAETNHRGSLRSLTGLASSSSSSSSESTESSVEWIPMTKNDLMQQGHLSRKRSQPSPSLTLDTAVGSGPTTPPKIPRRDYGSADPKTHHNGKKHKKARDHRRRHRHHGRHRHKKWRPRDYVNHWVALITSKARDSWMWPDS